MRLRVATYNIHKGIGLDRARRPDRILDVLNEIDADVVALQEADRRFGDRTAVLHPEAIRRHSDYAHVPLALGGASIGWHGNAILVRRGITARGHGHIDLPTLEPRGAVFADLEAGAARLRVVAMHLDLSGLRRGMQARTINQVARDAGEQPVVLMGDLNEWATHGGCLREFCRHFSFAATGPSFHSRRPIGRLDRIMVSPGIEVAACAVHQSARARIASDHLPVWADLDIAG